ncbi:MAG: putative cobalt transporter subunit (CbtA) [Chloroflexi bacterium]|nr:putative cobalt transporter subunit (CbtA) [Chloroflexota bacterium]
MVSIRISALLVTILVGGLLAGLLAAGFHAVATEPIIDEAIAIEEMHHADEPSGAEPTVSRPMQKIGLFVGWLTLGFIYAALLGVSYVVARTRGWVGSGRVAPAVLTLAAYFAIALVPALKYPANPPGVGDPDSIGFRQSAFIACWALSIAGAVLAAAIAVRIPLGPAGRAASGALVFLVWSVGLYLVLPANPDPITMPPALVDAFRVRSVEGLTLFWLVLGAVLAAFSARLTQGSGTALGK